MPCPIHNGKDYNLSFTDHGFICFVCGAKGDAVAFVQQVLSLPTRLDAIKSINRDLHLGLPIDSPAPVTFTAEMRKRRREQEEKERRFAEWQKGRDDLEDEWAILDQIIRNPKSKPEEVAKANARISFVEYSLNCYPPEPER